MSTAWTLALEGIAEQVDLHLRSPVTMVRDSDRATVVF